MSEARKVPPPAPEIPDKLYFRIGEVARLLRVETHTLRFWEGEFPQLRVGKGGTGQRLYRRKDVEVLLEIKHLLYDQGYTIPGARQFLQSRGKTAISAAPTAPAKQAAPAATPPAAIQSKNLNGFRSALQEISDLLSREPDASAGPERSQEKTQPTAVPRTGPQGVSRGIHLAPRAAKASGTQPPSRSAPLFDASENSD